MRKTMMTTIACLMILAVPAVAAEDPNYELPDPTEVQTAADAAVAEAGAAAETFSGKASGNATGAADDAQDRTFPGSRAAGALRDAGNFTTAVVGAADGFAGSASGWAVTRAENKRDEGFATADASIAVVIAGIAAADQVSAAAVGVVCGDPLVNAIAQNACGPDSVVTEVRDQADDFVAATASQATSDRTAGLIEAVESLISNIVGLPDL